ncbi:MAG: sigma-54 factor interaction domain-containing protein, partial [Myxococcales bacterium]|nr:sigma-54 factor interaction domain-containing protein [Myxococcales bacterium]
MTDRALPATLVVAADSKRRATLEEAALPLGPVIAVSPRELEPVTRFLDVLAIVLEVSPREASRASELFDPVIRLPAWSRASILIDAGLPDAAIGPLLAAWEPARLLHATAGEAALRYTLGQVHAAQNPESSRAAHRPARAILGVSAAIRDLLREVRKVAGANVPVLISGETGTGKELVARAIHREGKRRDKPFVAVNCGALAENLLEAELFGHVKGAFTGADRDKPGLFEQADGGTLFLDEIGDTTPALQVKLLRAIEEGEIRRVGDTQPRHVEVRIVSATHRDLEAAVDARTFREDLFYRLNTFTLHVP